MLIEFEVGNYLSFKKPVRFSMIAANPIKEFMDENTFEEGRLRLLKSAVIYGANASGKSNFLFAMRRMRFLVINSLTDLQGIGGVRPFALDAATENAPSHFEICFLLNNQRYRYGFEADSKSITKEWLFSASKQKEDTLFIREGDAIDVGDDFSEGNNLEEKTRDNALFLSVVAQFNGPIARSIMGWFNSFFIISGFDDAAFEGVSNQILLNEVTHPLLVDIIKQADMGIMDLIASEVPTDAKPILSGQKDISASKTLRVATVHKKFRDGNEDGIARLDFFVESEGTKKFYRIIGPILACLNTNSVICIDELDAKLHHLLTKAVVKLFNSTVTNKRNSQLIFSTHDTNLLNYGNLRRDQIWFTEKDQQGATDLYSLAEVKVRNDEALEKNYIRGKYGAIPYIGDFESLFKTKASNGSPN